MVGEVFPSLKNGDVSLLDAKLFKVCENFSNIFQQTRIMQISFLQIITQRRLKHP